LDLVDLIDLEFAFFTNDRGVFLWNQTKPRHRVTGDGFDLKPDFQFALVRPDGTHFRPRITGDHRSSLVSLSCNRKSQFPTNGRATDYRSEEHTSELQSRRDLVCRLLLEKKKKKKR